VIITEFELRANWHKTKEKVITVPQGSVITPAARDFLRTKGIQIKIEGDGIADLNAANYSTSVQSMIPGAKNGVPVSTSSRPDRKPEHMTHLRRDVLVPKTHPVIALRGQLDLFQNELVQAQIMFGWLGEDELVAQIDEIAGFARQLMAAEVKGEPFAFDLLIGLSPDQLREMSQHPEKYFGVKHTILSSAHGSVVAKLQYLRAKVREVELHANMAFTDEQGNCTRTDIVQALNRLSSAFYIMACRARARGEVEKSVPIGISNRHVHLSQEHLTALFGSGYKLTIQKELSQPGQFAARETVTLVGPKGTMEKVRVLGPVRPETQVELSVTDCYKLGVKPVVRDSGRLDGTEGVTLVGPAGKTVLEKGVIVAGRHIHLHTDQAQKWGLSDGQRVRVLVRSQRQVMFDDVLVRAGPTHEMEMHLDTDEANSALIVPGDRGIVVGV
jgi:propanediol utilization protein/ethanolamine utilization cobalamin adenosyltransferase